MYFLINCSHIHSSVFSEIFLPYCYPFLSTSRLQITLRLLCGGWISYTASVLRSRVFAYPTSLKADLDRYAALNAQTYGEAVSVTTPNPHILEAFMTGGRGFRCLPK
ncbi:DUF2274 domain-containing protein [Pectobacterium brasiliense]|uniref:DUF2274 domain-containing protein n=1 Tax=Pectobacterium brasiliense TaxID=180957 RepID=UPI003EB8F07C